MFDSALAVGGYSLPGVVGVVTGVEELTDRLKLGGWVRDKTILEEGLGLGLW